MSKLLVVLDTNVLISSAFKIKKSIPDQILQAFKNQKFILITSVEILKEIEDVLNREKIRKITKMTKDEIKRFLEDMIDIAFIVPGDVIVQAVLKDPDDDKFIAAALEGSADYVVSGDKLLLNLKEYHRIKIVSPADFVKIISDSNPA